MTLFRKPFIRRHPGKRRTHHDVQGAEVASEYIDLSELVFEDEPGAVRSEGECMVHVGEVSRFEDLHTFLDYVYKGDIMVLDISPVSGDELTIQRISSEIRGTVNDIGGDVAGIGKELIMVTPSGIRIGRSKLRLSED